MKFLVIGASGFIGSHTLKYIKSSGHNAIGTQSQKRDKDLITFDILTDKIQDCIDKSFFDTTEPIFAVLCAFILGDNCLRQKGKSYKINVENMIRLIEYLAGLNVKPVFISSSIVFDGKQGHYTEDDPVNPICEYGRHKVQVEKYIQKNIPDSLILRLDKIVGDSPNEEHLLVEWYRLVKEKKPIRCIANQVISPTLVSDIAESIFVCCKKDLSGIYHIANTEFFSREELAKQFILSLSLEAKIVSKPLEDFNLLDKRPLKTYLDSSKFIKETHFRFTPMREVMAKFKQNVH